VSNRRNLISILYACALLVGLAYWTLITFPQPTIPDWVVMYTLAGLLILLERYKIIVTATENINVETAYLIGFALVFPIHLVIWAGIMYSIVSAIRYRSHWYTQVANGIGFTISIVVAHYVYRQLGGTAVTVDVQHVIPLVVFGTTYFVVNMSLVLVYMVQRRGKSAVISVLRSLTPRFLAICGVTISIGILLAFVLNGAGLPGSLLFASLTLLVSYSFRDYFHMANHFKELSIKDELTGLYNHRFIQSTIDQLIEQKRPFALLMMDIDHFRRYNEVWGHIRGDEALKTIADILRSKRLPDEEIARYSGEEFAIVLPDYDLSQANLKAEMLRKAIEDTEFPGAERLPGKKLTVSIGVAHYPDQAESKNELLMMVDDALYKGKFTGRNKVSLYTSVLDDMKRELTMDEADQEIVKTIKVFLAILNSKDRYTYAHTERDVIYAVALAKRIGLPEERIRYLRFGAFLHDIGKVEIPIEVLTKRGPLTREEWQIMKSHVEIGENIAKPIPSLAPCLPIIRHHHERYDGTGYPDGLKGEEIPLEARILTIADSFDAMTTSRPYQRKRSMEEAFEELRSCAGRQFDPDLVEPFIEVVKEIGLLSETSPEDMAQSSPPV
jgi:diguanylate cyclase (GGDEF)-like protein